MTRALPPPLRQSPICGPTPPKLRPCKTNGSATAAFVDTPLIRSRCRQLDLGGRRRRLTPQVTTHLFIRQILQGNTSIAELRRLAKMSFADFSYCAARQRLPLAFFQRLSAAVLDRCRRYNDNDPRALWCGHRVFFLDGSASPCPTRPTCVPPSVRAASRPKAAAAACRAVSARSCGTSGEETLGETI